MAGQKSGAEQQAQAAARRRPANEQLDQLVAHPLHRDPGEHVQRLRDGQPGRPVDREAERGSESHRSQRPQPVLAEARQGIADRAEPAPPEVLGTRERIPQHAGDRVPGDRVHREVAARQISLDVGEEGDGARPPPSR